MKTCLLIHYAVVSKYNGIIYIITFIMVPASKYIGVSIRKGVNCYWEYIKYYNSYIILMNNKT